MDKRGEPLTMFRWRKDADGYALDGGRIVRRGGRMIEYDPATARPALHRVFAELHSHVDVTSALLAFVNEFGFLGSDRTGADAESEDVNYILKQSTSLRLVRLWAALTGGLSSMGNSQIATGFLELELATGKIVTHLKPANSNRGRGEPTTEKTVLHLTSLRDALEFATGRGALDRARDALVSLEIEEALTGPNLRMVFAPSGPHGRMQVRYEPESLYAWMWLRTADDLTSGVDWSGAPCLYCMNSFGRGPRGDRRRGAEFCSDNHRTYFNRLPLVEQRKRRKQAKELARGQHMEGSSNDIG